MKKRTTRVLEFLSALSVDGEITRSVVSGSTGSSLEGNSRGNRSDDGSLLGFGSNDGGVGVW